MYLKELMISAYDPMSPLLTYFNKLLKEAYKKVLIE